MMLVILPILTSLPCIARQATAQSSSSNFQTYTNTDYGFTIRYPSEWTVDDKNMSTLGVKITSPDKFGGVLVTIENLKPNETKMTAENFSDSLSSNPPTGLKFTEINKNTYFLSGHPAIRMTGIISFGGPGEPGATQGIVGDTKMMNLITVLGEKRYSVGYIAPTEKFPDYLQTAQTMIDSFEIITKQ
jgi:hypothetical protein